MCIYPITLTYSSTYICKCMHCLFTYCTIGLALSATMLHNVLPPPDHSPFHTSADTKVNLQDPQLYEVKQSTP